MLSRMRELANQSERTEIMSLPDEAKHVLNDVREGMIQDYYPSRGCVLTSANYAPYGIVERPASENNVRQLGIKIPAECYALTVTALLIFEGTVAGSTFREAWQVPLLIVCDRTTHLPLSIYRMAMHGPVNVSRGHQAFLR